MLAVYVNASSLPLAVRSHRDVQVVEVHSDDGRNDATVVDIGPVDQPVLLNWVSQSSTLKTNQRHISAPGSLQKDSVEDKPQVLLQEILRPVVQEIREIVVPRRNIVQEIRPVQESVQTIVARGQNRGTAGNGGGNGGLGALGGALGGGYGGYGQNSYSSSISRY